MNANQNKFVCPNPDAWLRIHKALLSEWGRLERNGDKPPVPLILNGWTASNDFDKNTRWKETVRWAEERELSNVTSSLEKVDMYVVQNFNSYRLYEDHYYGPHDPAPDPDHVALNMVIKELKENWKRVVGEKLASCSSPIRFTGRKRRRLVVIADGNFSPPWGYWFSINRGKRSFTEFRKSINDEISPHHVDHVDFRVQ